MTHYIGTATIHMATSSDGPWEEIGTASNVIMTTEGENSTGRVSSLTPIAFSMKYGRNCKPRHVKKALKKLMESKQ